MSFVTVRQVAKYYGVDRSKVTYAVHRRRLRAYKVHGRVLLDTEDLPDEFPTAPSDWEKEHYTRIKARPGRPRKWRETPYGYHGPYELS